MARQNTDPDATADHLGFAERLILAEERRRAPDTQPPPHRPEVVVIERTDFTTNSGFRIQEPGRSMPIEGAGKLVNCVIVADSDQFDVYLSIDGGTQLADPFTTLSTRSAELERAAAYERSDGQFVWTASGYDFRREVNAVITPQESITFALQRAELDLDRSARGDGGSPS